jgi:hypothetical protein
VFTFAPFELRGANALADPKASARRARDDFIVLSFGGDNSGMNMYDSNN